MTSHELIDSAADLRDWFKDNGFTPAESMFTVSAYAAAMIVRNAQHCGQPAETKLNIVTDQIRSFINSISESPVQ